MITINKKRVNNHVVKPAPNWGGEDRRPVKGAELFPEVYCLIFACAAKKSGKTSLCYHILKSCTSKQTKLIFFVSTLYKDPSWLYMKKYFESKGYDVEAHIDMFEDGVDVLGQMVKELEEEAEQEVLEEEEVVEEVKQPRILDPKQQLMMNKSSVVNFYLQKYVQPPQVVVEEERKQRKSKYQVPELFFVFDDLSHQLKKKSLVTLINKHRHFKCKILISSQYYLNMLPESRAQIDYFLVFGGQTEEKLETIYLDADLPVDYPLFEKLYKDATTKTKHRPKPFLYIDKNNVKFRRNLDEEYDISEAID